jgi:hypothetical protein
MRMPMFRVIRTDRGRRVLTSDHQTEEEAQARIDFLVKRLGRPRDEHEIEEESMAPPIGLPEPTQQPSEE